MEKILMSASSIAGIVLVLVGLIKTPIKRYKEAKWYRPLLTLITFTIIFACCTICELFILELPFLSFDFVWLLLGTIACTMFSYNGVYEGLGLKDAKNKLFQHIKELKTLSPEAKAVKKVEKVESTLINLYTLSKEVFDSTMVTIRQKAEAEKAEAEKKDK